MARFRSQTTSTAACRQRWTAVAFTAPRRPNSTRRRGHYRAHPVEISAAQAPIRCRAGGRAGSRRQRPPFGRRRRSQSKPTASVRLCVARLFALRHALYNASFLVWLRASDVFAVSARPACLHGKTEPPSATALVTIFLICVFRTTLRVACRRERAASGRSRREQQLRQRATTSYE